LAAVIYTARRPGLSDSGFVLGSWIARCTGEPRRESLICRRFIKQQTALELGLTLGPIHRERPVPRRQVHCGPLALHGDLFVGEIDITYDVPSDAIREVDVTPYAQDGYRLRCDWGLTGAREIAGPTAIVAVVDVLSFTTTLTVAADVGIEVFPYRWRDDSAADYARKHKARLAVGRSQAALGDVSLSPATIRAGGAIDRLVLPSPNGSTIAHEMASLAQSVIGVSLRNVAAAAAWTAARMGDNAYVAAVPAGERWHDGSLRPAVEDMWGAGAYLAALAALGIGPISPEAQMAIAAFRDMSAHLRDRLRDCASGRELMDYGFGQDVDIAAEFDQSRSVPVLHGVSFSES
jgi:2-phosphosulfolactate phosphatase